MLRPDRVAVLKPVCVHALTCGRGQPLAPMRACRTPRPANFSSVNAAGAKTQRSGVEPVATATAALVHQAGGLASTGTAESGDFGRVAPAQATSTPVVLTTKADGFVISVNDSCLEVDANGSLRLWKLQPGRRLTASGSVTLPRKRAPPESFRIVDGHANEGGWFHVEAVWGEEHGGAPAARLRVTCPPHAGLKWCKGLQHGFALQFEVARSAGSMAELCLHMETSGHWFGGGHFMRQLWPLNDASWEVGPFYNFDAGPNGLNTLISPQWMTTRGLVVVADPDTPFLHVGMNAPDARNMSGGAGGGSFIARTWGVGVQNAMREHLPLHNHTAEGRGNRGDGMLRLQARADYECHAVRHPLSDWTPSHTQQGDYIVAHVALAAALDVRDAALTALRTLTPPALPTGRALLSAPIWTTWARYHARVTQQKVLRYADEIVERGLERSVMEIDDRWQQAYGDLEFDSKKFPDARGMVDRLHSLGFKVTLWVMPFVEEASAAYREGEARGFFVKSEKRRLSLRGWLKPGFFRWWNTQPVCALDVTNPDAVDWFVARLHRLQEVYGIDGFKFDAGEPCFLPPNFQTAAPLAHPTQYTSAWVSQVAGRFQGGVSEVRTGYMTQHVGMFTRMGDRFSTWSVTNGLRSIIPTALTSGLLGYPFCLPDMIGGNCYFGQRPDSELMVRWTQLNALLPAMQFSVPPWECGGDAERFCAAALGVRRQLQHVLDKVAAEAESVLKPIVRPMWWLDPHDAATWGITDQFALGDDLIVAPVVRQGAVVRDVYLTQGLWRDVHEPSNVLAGGAWLRGWDAPLHILPCFQRVVDIETSPAAEGA